MYSEANSGKCVIFSAPSGAGKTTIVRHLLAHRDDLAFSVSATSRKRRNNETDGLDYHFLSVSQFKERIEEGDFIEWEEVYSDHFYGTLKSEIERIWKLERHVIFDVDVMGGINLKKAFGDQALSVFVKPPSVNALEQRLRVRETETEESIRRRVAKAGDELEMAEHFDEVLLNDNLHEAKDNALKMVSKFLDA